VSEWKREGERKMNIMLTVNSPSTNKQQELENGSKNGGGMKWREREGT